MPQNITEDKLIVSGTYNISQKRSYEIKITPRNNENPGGGAIGYSVFEWRITNIDRLIYLKFTQSDTTVIVQRYDASDGTYQDHEIGIPIYVGDKIQEVNGGGNFDASNSAIISSINTGTEGVNVKSFEIDAVPDAVSGKLEAQVKYIAQPKSHSSNAVPRLCSAHPDSSNKVSHTALHGLEFYFNHANMASTALLNVGGGGGLENSYYYYRFTAYAQKVFNADVMTRTVKDGSHGVLGWDSVTSKLSFTPDIYSDKNQIDNTSGVTKVLSYNRILPNKPCMTARGDDVYIGAGRLRNPVYAGYPNFKQFGKKMGDDLVVEDGNIIVNSSVLPQFEQFVFPKSNGSTTFASITDTDWSIDTAGSIIVGYEKDSGYLIKATRDGGIESSFYCGGKISAIRLDPVETNKVWVLINAVTNYKIIKIAINASGTNMAIDANRIYSISSLNNLIPSAASIVSRLTDILVLDNIIYIQASAYNVEEIGVKEGLFNGVDTDRKAYIWRSADISGTISAIPASGSTILTFTDMTPSFSPTENDATGNNQYEPYWYKYTEVTEDAIGTDPSSYDYGQLTGRGIEYISQEGFVPSSELGDEVYQLKYGLPLRGLCIWNAKTNEESIGLMIPYTVNSKDSSSGTGYAQEVYSNTEYNDSNPPSAQVTTTEFIIGPFIRRANTRNYLLGSHIQLFHNSATSVSGRDSSASSQSATNYTGIRRLDCSLTTKETSHSFGINTDSMNPSPFVAYMDGSQFTDFTSISTSIVDTSASAPKTVTIGAGTTIYTWDLWQGNGSALNPLHSIGTTDLSTSNSTFLPNTTYSNNTAVLNLSASSPIKKNYSPSNNAIDEDSESEMSSPIRLAAQTISYDTAQDPDETNTTAVNFPNSDFGIYFDNEIEKNTSQTTAWTKLSIDSAIEVSISSSSSSENNMSNLKIDAALDDPEEGSDSTTAYENANFYHNFYRVSIMYDGYQESCLSNTRYVASTNPDKTGHKITVNVRTNSISKRLSHINIYRAKGTKDSHPETDFQLIKSISLDGDGWITPASGDASLLSYNFDDIIGANFGTYESLTGISPAMNINYLSYSISESCSGYLFITDAQNAEISGVGNYIFRSKPGKYNVFNWANEYVALPEKINALQSYNNLLYAFSGSAVYTINPNNLSIIDSMQGQGALSDDSVIATDYGMFFADKYGLYMHNGKSAVKINHVIQDSDNSSLTNLDWNSIDWELNPAKLGFDSKRKSLLAFFIYNDNSYAWVYSVLQKRWDLWSFDEKITAIAPGKYGEILASDGRLIRIGTSSAKKAWEYQSKKITAGFDTYEKQFKEIHAEGTTGLAIKYKTGLASGSWNALSSESTGTGFTKGRLNTSHSKSKWLQLQVIDSNGTKQLESLGIHLRPLKAKSIKT